MIISKSNEYVKHIKSLAQKKYRDEFNEFIVEGIKLVKEAIEEKVSIKKIIICEEIFNEKINFPEIEYVDEKVFKYISETESPQGILAIVKQKDSNKELGNIIFSNFSMDRKRVEIKKLQKKGLDRTFVNMFMKLLEYVAQI